MFRILTAVILACISSAPCLAGLNVVVVLDDSGSMDERMRQNRRIKKMDAAKQALVSVLETLPEDAQVGIVLLNGKRKGDPWLVPLGPVEMTQVQEMMQKVKAYGGTPLGQYMKLGADQLLQLRQQQHYGNYRLLIVTDGEATDKKLVNRYLPDLLSRGITLDVIGVDMTANHSLATQVHSYRRADDPQSLTQAVAEVFAESSDDGGDLGESDFELLEGFPGELAAVALTTLGEMGNQPIGQSPTHRPDTREAQPPADPRPVLPQAAPGHPSGGRQEERRSWATNPVVIFACMAFVVLWFVISRSGGRRRHR